LDATATDRRAVVSAVNILGAAAVVGADGVATLVYVLDAATVDDRVAREATRRDRAGDVLNAAVANLGAVGEGLFAFAIYVLDATATADAMTSFASAIGGLEENIRRSSEQRRHCQRLHTILTADQNFNHCGCAVRANHPQPGHWRPAKVLEAQLEASISLIW
jgi:hypothetical protein